jgi:hypothetical protein
MPTQETERCLEIARQLFNEIAAAFPSLHCSILVDPHPEVALALEFKTQPGLLFPVSATLQNVDELHLHAGAILWYEWFPCYYPDRTSAFRQAIVGVLSGECRVLEFYRKGRPIRAELQRIESGVWRRVVYTTNARLPSFRKAERRILRNVQAGA